MKKLVYSIIAILFAGTMTLSAQSKTEKFKVYGNCGSCEMRIEKAAKSVEGLTTADWNKDTKMMEVSFDSDKTDVMKVHQAIADAGHDTDQKKAPDAVYGKLPGCCKYERK